MVEAERDPVRLVWVRPKPHDRSTTPRTWKQRSAIRANIKAGNSCAEDDAHVNLTLTLLTIRREPEGVCGLLWGIKDTVVLWKTKKPPGQKRVRGSWVEEKKTRRLTMK